MQQLEQILTIQLESRQRGDVSDFDFIGTYLKFVKHYRHQGTELWNTITIARKRAGPTFDKVMGQRAIALKAHALTSSALYSLFDASHSRRPRR
jgi:hypothetical protein